MGRKVQFHHTHCYRPKGSKNQPAVDCTPETVNQNPPFLFERHLRYLLQQQSRLTQNLFRKYVESWLRNTSQTHSYYDWAVFKASDNTQLCVDSGSPNWLQKPNGFCSYQGQQLQLRHCPFSRCFFCMTFKSSLGETPGESILILKCSYR